MRRRFRVPMLVVAAALLGLIALLATLQYRWLGQISRAERERMKATLNAHAAGFAQDFDRELTRAYLLFQVDALQEGESVAARMSARYDRWQATSSYPRILSELYVVPYVEGASPHLQRFNPSTRFLEPAEWPDALNGVRDAIVSRPLPSKDTVLVHTIPPALWDQVPALVVPTPLLIVNHRAAGADFRVSPSLSYTVLLLDRNYIASEMMPSLAQQHFHGSADSIDYQLAVISATAKDVVYRSSTHFAPQPDAAVDASVELFEIRVQEFGAMAAEVRRFTTLITGPRGARALTTFRNDPGTIRGEVFREMVTVPPGGETGPLTVRESAPLSIVVQQRGTMPQQQTAVASGAVAAASRLASANRPRWRLLVKHPAGSLESAVNAVRRRNLVVSSGILAILGASTALLVLSTRRAQRLARQQMEFVAAVSHELRTPLAVIRSAAENLADGVVHDEPQIRKYGELVRTEGRRLTEMVEQILELAGIQSGQRGFALRAVPVAPLLHEVVESSAALIQGAGISVEFDLPHDLPAVLGDEAGLRRVFQNLVGNAVKYGAAGKWIGITARRNGDDVRIAIRDRGMGIAAAEQDRIFEPFYRAPDVVSAQIQGAGLGLSLVHRIVEAHGGRVSVQSVAQQGSEFQVDLPAAAEQPAARHPAGSEASSTPAAAEAPWAPKRRQARRWPRYS